MAPRPASLRSHAPAIACLILVLLAPAIPATAHDLPVDVIVHVFLKPEAQRLRLIVRVPLEAMGDVDYPTRGAEGLLDLTRIDQALHDAVALWLTPAFDIYADGSRLSSPRLTAVRLSLPSDRSFTSYEEAFAHVTGARLPAETQLYWKQATLDALLEYDLQSELAALAVRPSLARLGVRVVTALRVVSPDGGVRAFEFAGDPGLVRLDPRWYQAAWRFVQLGFGHILSGADHLLFLVCLAIPMRRLGALVPVVTAFAVAHSITLIASALDLAPTSLWFPPLVETLIAVSIVYMALENMLARAFAHRWMVAFGFGLVHGFGFGFALRESLQFAGAHLLTSLLSFNVGVELGQLLVLLLIVPPLALIFRRVRSERIGTVVMSAVVAHTAWHWMVDRADALSRFSFQMPHIDAALGARAAGWLLMAVVAAGAFWLLSVAASWVRRLQSARPRTAGAQRLQD